MLKELSFHEEIQYLKSYIINKSDNISYVIYHCEGHTTKTVFKSDLAFIVFIAKLEFEVTSCIILPSNKFKASNPCASNYIRNRLVRPIYVRTRAYTMFWVRAWR